MTLQTVAMSNWHDGSICLVDNGQVKTHVIAERVNHNKHSEICEKTLSSLGGEFSGVKCSGYSRIESSHHIFHAFHSFYDSGFKKALCVVIDGMGCHVEINHPAFQKGTYGRESISAYLLEYPNKITLVYREVVVPFKCDLLIEDSRTHVTSTISPALMFQKTCESIDMRWYDAGKLMAMASYGKNIIDIKDEMFVGSDLKSFKLNYKLDTFEEKCDFAKSLQIQTQDRVIEFINKSIKKVKCKNVCMSGGYFLNCVANTHIRKNLHKNINTFVEPVCSDDGISIGLAKLLWYENTKSKRVFPLKSIYFGKKRELDLKGRKVTAKDVAKLISDKKVIGIFQSRSESGPRALGNRSLLYDPRDPNGRDRINKLKGREEYRPLAATVLQEHAHVWFDMCGLKESPYMLYTLDVLSDKVPAVNHVDNTCRVQTLKKNFNKHYYDLIKEFYEITHIPMVLNTSLNLAGDTIVETVDDALNTLRDSEIDHIYFPEIETLV
jgi:carbamoyltransferase